MSDWKFEVCIGPVPSSLTCYHFVQILDVADKRVTKMTCRKMQDFQDTFEDIGVEGPSKYQWGDEVTVFQGGRDMGSLMKFKQANLSQ